MQLDAGIVVLPTAAGHLDPLDRCQQARHPVPAAATQLRKAAVEEVLSGEEVAKGAVERRGELGGCRRRHRREVDQRTGG